MDTSRSSDGRLGLLLPLVQSITSSSDLDEVLERVVRAATGLVEDSACTVWTAEGSRLVVRIRGGARRSDWAGRSEFAIGEGLVGHAARDRRAVVVHDVLADPRTQNRDYFEAEGLVACAALPLLSRGELVGVLALFTRRPEDLGDAELTLLSAFGASAAIAIANARLFAAEQAARREAEASARRFEELVDSLDAIVVESDDTSRVTFVNRRAETILGYPRERWYAQPDFWAEHVVPADRYRAIKTHAKAIAEHRDRSVEYRMCAADGRTVWLSDSIRILPADASGRRRTRRVLVDVTGRKRAEALLAGERCIVESIAAGAALAPVLDSICRLIESQHPGARASILLVDADGRLRHGAAPSLPGSYVHAIDGFAIGPEAGSCGTAAYLRKTVVVADITNDRRWAVYRDVALQHGLRACWSSPVLDGAGTVMATFAVYYTEPQLPRAEEIELVNRATQITRIALERERALVALRNSEERYRGLVTHLPAVTWLAETGGRTVFISPSAAKIVGYTAEELSAGGREAWLAGVHSDDVGAVRAAFEALVARGAAFDVEYRMRHKRGHWIWIRDRAVSTYEHGGIVYATGVCTDITERKQAETVRSRLLRQVVHVQEDERARLARELHDETAQSLAALLIGLQGLRSTRTAVRVREQAERLHAVAARALAEVRRMTVGLRPTALDHLGLVPALERHAAELGDLRGLPITVRATGLEGERLPPDVEIVLYRIMQEALSNVGRHAGASKAIVSLTRADGMVTMEITDDGHGFDVTAALHASGERVGIGLHTMRERAALVQGTTQIESEPGRGTRVMVEIPLAP